MLSVGFYILWQFLSTTVQTSVSWPEIYGHMQVAVGIRFDIISGILEFCYTFFFHVLMSPDGDLTAT